MNYYSSSLKLFIQGIAINCTAEGSIEVIHNTFPKVETVSSRRTKNLTSGLGGVVCITPPWQCDQDRSPPPAGRGPILVNDDGNTITNGKGSTRPAGFELQLQVADDAEVV